MHWLKLSIKKWWILVYLLLCVNAYSEAINLFMDQAGRSVTGIVTDESGNPIIGANIKLKEKNEGVITDINGRFVIDNVGDKSVITVSYIGYLTQEVLIGKKSNLIITLKENNYNLNEVIVVGYGDVRRKELTSAISHISQKDFLNVSSTDVSMLIQGKVPGVSVTNISSGDPNSLASIQIRGISSRSAGLGPLIVIDGVPGGNLTNINQTDIESIDVLKDGAASSIYGTRGSNGVILITTKKGIRDNKIHTTYYGYAAIDYMNSELDVLDANEFKKYRVAKELAIDMGGNTDWLNLISRNGFTHKHVFTLTGGGNKSNYRASVDFRDATGIDIRSRRKEYGANLALNHTTNNGLLTFSLHLAPRIIYRNNSEGDVYRVALEANPTTPLFDSQNPSLYTNFNGQWASYNPVEKLELEDRGGDTKLLDWSAIAKVDLLKLFPFIKADIFNTQITIADQQNDNFNYWFRPSTSTLAINSGFSGEASESYDKTQQRSLEWIGNYLLERNGHKLKVLAGYSYQYFVNKGLNANNKNFPSDALKYNNLGQGEWAKQEGQVLMGSYKNDSKLIGFFNRISYDYKERYIVSLSSRYEGSSKFGKSNKWGWFPAISLGWRISDESFLKNIKWINDLKIRADMGVTGNQEFSSYLSLATMQGFGGYYYNGKWFTVWGPAKNPNPNLKWEKGINWNAGVDFSFFNHRLSGSLNYYFRKQQDLLGDYNVSVPPYLFSSIYANVGSMMNRGIELDISMSVLKTRNFKYEINFVGSTNINKFLNFSNEDFKGQSYWDVAWMEEPNMPGYLQRIEEGKRIGNFYTWAYAGIDEDGNWLVWNKDNTKKIPIKSATTEDKRITGNGLPKFSASITNSFVYKNWDLTLFFRGNFGFDLYNVHSFYYGLQTANGNVLKEAYTKNNKITSGFNVLTDYFLERGDYLKLDVATLGYQFNIHNKWINKIRAYITGKNLFTITKFSGIDPANYQINGLIPGTNNGSRSYYPSTTQLLFGVQIDF